MEYEPILSPKINRHVVFPIRYPHIWEYYKKACSSIWLAEEIDLSRDIVDWTTKLTHEERHFLSYILAFFAVSDGIVNENLVQRFASEVTIPEARHFYGAQIFIENVHAETYANLVTTLVSDPRRRNELLNATSHVLSISAKTSWATKWINNDEESFATRLMAFAAVEGIFFSASFAAIFWMKSRGLMPGLCFSNELISRDEGMHTDFACLLYQYILNKPRSAKVLGIILEAVEAEKAFIKGKVDVMDPFHQLNAFRLEALPIQLDGMNASLMSEYIEFVADHLLQSLGVVKHFNTKNPFPFMEQISVDGKANFFERQVSAYTLSSKIVPELEYDDDLSHIDL